MRGPINAQSGTPDAYSDGATFLLAHPDLHGSATGSLLSPRLPSMILCTCDVGSDLPVRRLFGQNHRAGFRSAA